MRLLIAILTAAVLAGSALPARAADDSKVKAATEQVQTGAKKIGDSEVGSGTKEMAKGIGNTTVKDFDGGNERSAQGADTRKG